MWYDKYLTIPPWRQTCLVYESGCGFDLHFVTKNAPTLASCSLNKDGLILKIFGKQHITLSTRGQSNLTKSASRGAHSPVRGHPRGSKVVPLNSWGRVSY